MRGTWQGTRARALAALLFLAFWVATWVVTVATWEVDATGHSVGMNVIALPLHLVLPLAVGGLIGLFRSSPDKPLWKASAFAGLVFGAIHFAMLLLVDVVWLPAVESELGFLEFAAEALAFALVYLVICVVLGMIGGSVSRTVASNPVRQ